MIENIHSSDELLTFAEETNLYITLLQQLARDFERANISFPNLQKSTKQELQQTLKEKLYVLLLEQYEDFNRLLYLIDIPERNFKQIKSKDVVELSSEIVFVILKREFQKVWYRNKAME